METMRLQALSSFLFIVFSLDDSHFAAGSSIDLTRSTTSFSLQTDEVCNNFFICAPGRK
jgi:hypothetical protein